MKTIKNLERLQLIHSLIKIENTGSPSELAKRMRISERLVYNLIEQLRDYKTSISYNRGRKTYYYCEDFQLMVNMRLLQGDFTFRD